METDKEKMPFVAPIRPFNLIWVFVLAGGWAANMIWGTPHLRVQYTWNGRDASPHYYSCWYWGLSTFQVRPINGKCPLLVLASQPVGH